MADELFRYAGDQRFRTSGRSTTAEPATIVGELPDRARNRRCRDSGTAYDRGSATMLLLGAMLVLAAATAVASAVGVVASHRQKAATAADLAALAAAAETSDDLPIACSRAATVADANGGHLEACAARNGSVEVVTSVGLPGVLTGFGPLHAIARAGPWPPP